VSDLESQLKQEKSANKSWQVQIKRFETHFLACGLDPKNSQGMKKILDEKENTSQTLNKNLKVPT
jgi:hypothetical protein